ncbi:uncharacterized protein LOC108863788 [Galendromus occidentalis]|uniref:Uncharacterized protein LOC108863788 n=1 Tax=Galendromus occidentalis TaxID=34638 RepID=A0AAJ7L4K2_9ACAR|nr:uncharacterized protein LOC108863788 [Galendromus occidentalis]
MRLQFNPKKSAMVVFSGHLCKLPQRDKRRSGPGRTKNTLHRLQAQLLWSSNRFELSKTYWKAVAVPKLTYTNAVTSMTAATRDAMEISQRPYYRQISERIRTTQDLAWVAGISGRTMLRVYRHYKDSRTSPVHIYDNSRGSALLALARAGSLPTRVHRSLFSTDPETTCNKCGVYPETLEHVIFNCNECYFTTDELAIKLGLTTELNRHAVESTKRLLEKWERETSGSAEPTRA